MNKHNSTSELIRSVIQRIAVGPDRGRDISAEEAYATMRAILAGEVDEVQTAVILIALRMKRESLEEFVGLYRAMQETVKTHTVAVEDLYCLADPFDGYLRHESMTPFLPAVLAACGLSVVLTGVESVGPKHGVTASKVYQLAGIKVDIDVAAAARLITKQGWAYLDQTTYAAKIYALYGLRERIVKRTAVTTLERLLMPLHAEGRTHAVLGYVHRAYPEIYSHVAAHAGYASCVQVKGVEGGLAPALNKPLRQSVYHFDAQTGSDDQKTGNADALQRSLEVPATLVAETAAELAQTRGASSARVSLEKGLAVLGGEPGTARNSLVLSAAHILYAHGHSDSLISAVEKVRDCLDNGSASLCFNAVRRQ